jgi:hypothetical protein
MQPMKSAMMMIDKLEIKLNDDNESGAGIKTNNNNNTNSEQCR